jgi:hypothetical protein
MYHAVLIRLMAFILMCGQLCSQNIERCLGALAADCTILSCPRWPRGQRPCMNWDPSLTIWWLTLPSLSTKDWPLLDVLCWTLTNSILEELDSQDCTYNMLLMLPFGLLPSLPTLDVHYCSQVWRLSWESMITHLLKSAKEFEDYVKSAE